MSRLRKTVAGLLKVCRARWALRRCTQVGSLVRVRGRPRVDAAGRIEIGPGVSIHSHIATTQLSAGASATLRIGENTFVNNGVVMSARKLVSVGARCQIAPGVVVMDSDFHDPSDLSEPGRCEPVVIEDDVWLATRAMVLPGVRVGRGAVVAAGAVVTRDVEAHTLVAGVPARPVRKLDEETGARAAPLEGVAA